MAVPVKSMPSPSPKTHTPMTQAKEMTRAGRTDWGPIVAVAAALIVCVGLIMTGVSLGIIRPDQVLGLT